MFLRLHVVNDHIHKRGAGARVYFQILLYLRWYFFSKILLVLCNFMCTIRVWLHVCVKFDRVDYKLLQIVNRMSRLDCNELSSYYTLREYGIRETVLYRNYQFNLTRFRRIESNAAVRFVERHGDFTGCFIKTISPLSFQNKINDKKIK